jgi:hypothetical protein
MGDLIRVESSLPVQLVDANDLQVADITSLTPVGTESGLIVRNIPNGTQTVEGTITASPTGTYTVTGSVTAVPSGTQTISGTVTSSPSGTYTVTLDETSLKSKGLNTLRTLSPNGTAALVASVNANRASILIYNAGSVTVFLGQSNGVTTDTGMPLLPNASLEDTESKDSWYAITNGTTGNLRIVETAI